MDGSVALIDAPAPVMESRILAPPAQVQVKKKGLVEDLEYVDVQVRLTAGNLWHAAESTALTLISRTYTRTCAGTYIHAHTQTHIHASYLQWLQADESGEYCGILMTAQEGFSFRSEAVHGVRASLHCCSIALLCVLSVRALHSEWLDEMGIFDCASTVQCGLVREWTQNDVSLSIKTRVNHARTQLSRLFMDRRTHGVCKSGMFPHVTMESLTQAALSLFPCGMQRPT
jgi:hypothetical protein